MKTTARFTLELGVGVRKEVIRQVKNRAFMLGLYLHIDEDKGWFSSGYRCTIIGDIDKVRTFTEWINALSAANSDDR